MGARRGIPHATVARLPIYHRVASGLKERGVTTVSSDELALEAGVNGAKLRKDLSYLGSYGTRGVGYDVDFLVYQIARELGLTQDWPVLIVGVGNLGRALVNYGGFASRGFRVVGLLDNDIQVVGQHVVAQSGGSSAPNLTVRHLDDLENVVADTCPAIAVIATPAGSAQSVVDRLVGVGLRSVLNFAPVELAVPDNVEVRNVDLATELQILAFHEQRQRAAHGDITSTTGESVISLSSPADLVSSGGAP